MKNAVLEELQQQHFKEKTGICHFFFQKIHVEIILFAEETKLSIHYLCAP